MSGSIGMRQVKQLTLGSILDEAFLFHEKRFEQYIRLNKGKYKDMATEIKPSTYDDSALFSRASFAILSANVHFDAAIKALDYVMNHAGNATDEIMIYGMVPAKADYCNKLYRDINNGLDLRIGIESWDHYRLRLQRQVKGLGLCKASFTAALLYPLTADVACIDTWMQKVFLGNTGFRQLSLPTYQLVENRIRGYALKYGVSTFLAQWMIWDHARGDVEDHAVFPGMHKDL